MKVITILEGRIAEAKWDVLKEAYEGIAPAKERIMPVKSFLVQNTDDAEVWRIITVWEDMETLQKMRESTETPAGVRVFREAGGEPTLSIFRVQSELGE